MFIHFSIHSVYDEHSAKYSETFRFLTIESCKQTGWWFVWWTARSIQVNEMITNEIEEEKKNTPGVQEKKKQSPNREQKDSVYLVCTRVNLIIFLK